MTGGRKARVKDQNSQVNAIRLIIQPRCVDRLVPCRFRRECLCGEADEGLLMLLRIIKHEWRGLAADRAVWLIAVVFATLIGYGVLSGAL